MLESSMGILCDFNAHIVQSSVVATIMDAKANVFERIWTSGNPPAKLHGLNLPFGQNLTVELGGARTHILLLGTTVVTFLQTSFAFPLSSSGL